MAIDEARRACLARQAEPDETGAPARAAPLLREFVQGEWKEAHFSRYKPSTKKRARFLLGGRILPAFGSKPLDRITRAQVRLWFDAFSRTAPGNANHGLDRLRQVMNFAIALGHIDANPTHGIKRNRRPALTRFLSRKEIRRLHRVLDSQTRKGDTQQADIIRLLLLTGCRRGEIVQLLWAEVQHDALMLKDGKTGPRKVPLNSQARRILERRPRGESKFVVPSPLDPSRPRSSELPLWYRARREAGIEDVRLHNLRHSFASHAVLRGIPLSVVSRMLGHKRPSMTMRYAHVGDRETEAAAERIGMAIARALDGSE